MKYCLDTNIVIDLLNGDSKLADVLDELQGEYYTNPVILAELYKGAYLSKKRGAVERLNHFVSKAKMLAFNHRACDLFGKHWAFLKQKGKPTQEFDLLIASIALAHDAILITKNKKDFVKIPGLEVMGF